VNDLCVVCTEKLERPISRSKSKVQLTGHYQVVIERKSPSRDGLVKPIYATTQPQLLPSPSRAASTEVAGAGSASGVSKTPWMEKSVAKTRRSTDVFNVIARELCWGTFGSCILSGCVGNSLSFYARIWKWLQLIPNGSTRCAQPGRSARPAIGFSRPVPLVECSMVLARNSGDSICITWSRPLLEFDFSDLQLAHIRSHISTPVRSLRPPVLMPKLVYWKLR
jgi:hypothetical protein